MYFKLPPQLQDSVITAVLPASPDDPALLPYLPVIRLQGSFGQLYRQKIKDNEFVLYRQVFRIRHAVPLCLQVTTPQIILNYMQRGSLFCELQGYGKVMLAAGTSQLFYVPPGTHMLLLEPGEYMVSHVHLSPDYLQPLTLQHDGLRMVCQRVLYASGSARQEYAGSIHTDILHILDKIQRCRLSAGARTLFLQARVRDLLLAYLQDSNVSRPGKGCRYQFTAEDIYRLEQARREAAANLLEPLTMQLLAKKVNMHPRKLEAGLRWVYGLPAKLMIRQLRMEKAKELLRSTNESIASIAYECGYHDITTFVRAFRAQEHCKPMDYRKQE